MISRHEAERLHNAINYNTYLTDEEFADVIAKRIITTIVTIIIAMAVAIFFAFIYY